METRACPAPIISITSVTGGEASGSIAVALSLSEASTLPVRVTVSARDFIDSDPWTLATDGAGNRPDFDGAPEEYTFVPGSTGLTAHVPLIDERLKVSISNAVNATLAETTEVEATIVDNDALPVMSISTARTLHVHDEVTTFAAAFSLSRPTEKNVWIWTRFPESGLGSGTRLRAAGGGTPPEWKNNPFTGYQLAGSTGFEVQVEVIGEAQATDNETEWYRVFFQTIVGSSELVIESAVLNPKRN